MDNFDDFTGLYFYSTIVQGNMALLGLAALFCQGPLHSPLSGSGHPQCESCVSDASISYGFVVVGTRFQPLFLPVGLAGQSDLMGIGGQAVHDNIGHDLVRKSSQPVFHGVVTG